MVGFKASRRVLLVGGEGVVLYGPAGKGVDRETSISWEVPNFDQQLVEALGGKNQGKSVVVLFDGADQTYRKEENIPKLSPFDRPRFVKRKLEVAFPSYPIRASLEVKPPKLKGKAAKGASREQPSYLFVALPETEQLDRIGNAMFEAGVPVAGFGLLPLESTGLVNELSDKVFGGAGKKSRWAVLIGQHETGGLRQVVIKDGNLALTRLTPTSEAGISGTGWVEEVTREFKATLTYISRFGYSNDDGLDVIVVCGDVEKQFFDQKAIPVTNFRCVNLTEALKFIGVRAFGLEKSNFADALHAAWVGRKPALKLAVRIPSIHRIMAPRLAAQVASVLLVLGIIGLVGVSGKSFQEYRATEDEIAQKEIQKLGLDREYEQETKIFEALPVKPDVVKATLAVKGVLENNTADMRPLLHTLKNNIPSDVRFESLHVEHSASASLKVEGAITNAGLFGRAPDPKDRGQVLIRFAFTLPDSLTLEQKVARSEDLVKLLQEAFKGYDVNLKQQFENVKREGQSQGYVGDDPKAQKSGGGLVDTAVIELKGAPL
ncbi:MAG: hypothetical protein EPN97_07205 [Alphaproteobacteria bacterium]|nr:MAG: hypothetical protein EPN97_07205 [Alphaproteobacteria bacterium]